MARKKKEVIFGKLAKYEKDQKCCLCREAAALKAKFSQTKLSSTRYCCAKKECKQYAAWFVKSQVKKDDIARTIETGCQEFLANRMNYEIGENDIRARDMEAVNGLLKQLNPDASSIGMIELGEVTNYGGIIITARDITKDNLLVGMGTLVPIRKLFSFCGTIEDVVVDAKHQRKGLGRRIMSTLLTKGYRLGMKYFDLTSRPKRKEANKLYRSLGFKLRETNLYRLYN